MSFKYNGKYYTTYKDLCKDYDWDYDDFMYVKRRYKSNSIDRLVSRFEKYIQENTIFYKGCRYRIDKEGYEESICIRNNWDFIIFWNYRYNAKKNGVKDELTILKNFEEEEGCFTIGDCYYSNWNDFAKNIGSSGKTFREFRERYKREINGMTKEQVCYFYQKLLYDSSFSLEEYKPFIEFRKYKKNTTSTEIVDDYVEYLFS